MKGIFVAGILTTLSMQCFAEGNPWLIAPGDTNLSISYVSQKSDKFFLADKKMDMPIEQQTLWLSVNYGLTDNLAFDHKLGYAKNSTGDNAEVSDRADASLGLTWRFHDEFLHDNPYPSAALRMGAIIKGNYEDGNVNSIGDGASGVEFSLLLGKVVTNQFAVSGEIGYRNRNNNVPDEYLLTINAFYNLSNKLFLSTGYYYVNADSDVDIGDAGFSFSELDEDSETITIGASYQFTESILAGIDAGRVIDGRNTAINDIWSVNIAYSF